MAVATNYKIHPDFAKELVATYDWFEATGRKDLGERDELSLLNRRILTRGEFMVLLQELGSYLPSQPEDLTTIVAQLRHIAEYGIEITAGVPTNLEELVRDYETALKLAEEAKKDASKQPQLAQVKNKLQGEIYNYVEQNPDVIKKVPEARLITSPEAKETAAAVDEYLKQTKQEAPRPTIPEWMALDLDARVEGALKEVKIPEARIEEKKQEIINEVNRIKHEGIPVTQQQVEQIVIHILEKPSVIDGKQYPGIALRPEAIKSIEAAILPEFTSGTSHLITTTNAFDDFPRPVKIQTPPKIEERVEKKKEEPDLSKSTKNILYLWLQRPVSYSTRATDQAMMLVGGKSSEEKNLERFRTALGYIRTHETEYYLANELYFRNVEENLIALSKSPDIAGGIVDAKFIPSHELQDKLDEIQDYQREEIYRLDLSNADPNKIIAVRQSIGNLQRLYADVERRVQAEQDIEILRSNFGDTSGLVSGGIFSIVNTVSRGFDLQNRFAGMTRNGILSSFSLSGKIMSVGGLVINRFLNIFAGTIIGGQDKTAKIFLGIIAAVFVGLILLTTIQIGNTQSSMLKEVTSGVINTQSQYFTVTKSVTPNSYQGSLPTQAKYTVTITAKDKNLTNLSANDTFTISGKSNPPAPSTTLPQLPTSLEAGKTISVDFSLGIPQIYDDSVITNSFTVTADVDGGPKGEKSIGTAILTIGNPPTGCFNYQKEDVDWTSQDLAMMSAAIARITARSPKYMADLCSSGTLTVYRGSVAAEGESGHVIGKGIHLFNRAFSGPDQLFYTLTHESGHVYAKIKPSVYVSFSDSGATSREHVLPTYPSKYLNKDCSNCADEDFAESIADYVIKNDMPSFGGINIGNMSSLYPLHYKFAHDNIFGGQD